MDIKQLSIFITAAQTLNFTKAAQEHYMTQPAVSHQISELERELSAKLFIRRNHHMALTSAGQEFLPHAKVIVNRAELAFSKVYDVAHGKSGHLRILTVQGCLETTSECLFKFAQRYPNVKIEADVVTGAEQMDAISNDEADIFISFDSLLSTYPQIERRTLRRKYYGLLLPVSWDLCTDTSDLSHLANIPFICERDTVAPFLTNKIIQICKNRNLVLSDIHWCNSATSQILAVKSSLGCSITPTTHPGAFTDDLRIIPIRGEDAIADDTVGWKKGTGNQAVTCFLEVIQEMFPGPPLLEDEISRSKSKSSSPTKGELKK